MRNRNSLLFSLLLLSIAITVSADNWRSVLYPKNWTPGYMDTEGRFLHDFSYAGYMRGEQKIPESVGSMFVDVTQEPYNADNTGEKDATLIIQKAIDDVANAGGGTVYLPEGTYRVPLFGRMALLINKSNIILRGAGVGKTFLYNPTESMRTYDVIKVAPNSESDWNKAESDSYRLRESISDSPETTIYMEELGELQVGDWIIIRSNRTDEWIAEHNMEGFWDSTGSRSTNQGVIFYRQIVSIDEANKALEIDIPTRYYMTVRDDARVYKLKPAITNVGFEDFSIGNKKNSTSSGWGDDDYTAGPSYGAYQVHGSSLIKMNQCVNSWVRNVKTYDPGNTTGSEEPIHMLSNGLHLSQCRSLTVENCEFSYPQYEGGGGNGYGYDISTQECLFLNCAAKSARHSYSIKQAYASGNVIYNFYSGENPRGGSDFHMWLSMSNLIDNQTVKGDMIETYVRPWGADEGNRHGHTTTQTVFWNTHGAAYKPGYNFIVESKQYKYGYVIGTKGKATGVNTTPTYVNTIYGAVDTAPEDFVEGLGDGLTLEPASLYYDQLERRLGKGVCPPIMASGHDGNFPANVQDGDLETRWSAEGKGQWLQFYWGTKNYIVSGVKIAFHRGDERKALFDIYYLDENDEWKELQSGFESSGSTTELETFTFKQSCSTTKIRIVGQGTNADEWNSYAEVVFDATPDPTSIESYEVEKKKGFTIYPNPVVAGHFNILLKQDVEELVKLYISDISGRTILSKLIPVSDRTIVVEDLNLTSGSYLVTLEYSLGMESSIMIVQ